MKKGAGGGKVRDVRRQGGGFGFRGTARSHIQLQAIKRD